MDCGTPAPLCGLETPGAPRLDQEASFLAPGVEGLSFMVTTSPFKMAIGNLEKTKYGEVDTIFKKWNLLISVFWYFFFSKNIKSSKLTAVAAWTP